MSGEWTRAIDNIEFDRSIHILSMRSLAKSVTKIMLTQFKIRYPQGTLISELIEIDCDRYIVKASVVIDGVTIATGMAGCETI